MKHKQINKQTNIAVLAQWCFWIKNPKRFICHQNLKPHKLYIIAKISFSCYVFNLLLSEGQVFNHIFNMKY